MANEINKGNKLSNDVVSDLLREIVNPDSIDVEHLNKKDELCSNIWDSEDKMNPDVRAILLKNAQAFINYLKINNLNFKDVILTGSLANYNWTEQSDIDIHILMDLTQISDDTEFVSDYFKSKKHIWGNTIPVEVKGHEVELYVQDIDKPHASTGVYSLVKDKWLTKPIKTMIAIDTANIKLKTADIMNSIDELENNTDDIVIIDSVNSMMEKLKKMRKAGLDDTGEFSTENLVFKLLRNNGYLEKMLNIKNDSLKTELTLESTLSNIDEVRDLLIEGDLRNIIQNAKQTGMLTLGMVVGILATNISKDIVLKSGVPQELVHKAERYINTNFSDYLTKNKEKININNNEKELHNTSESVR